MGAAPKQKKAIIIGSGIAGIASAVRLRLKGYQTIVFEANDYPGGKLTFFQQDGYRFDAGPSLFTMPHYVDELFELAGKNPRAYFNYVRKENSCTYFWDDGSVLEASADNKKFAKDASTLFGVDEKLVLDRLKKSKLMYELAGRTFLEKPLNQIKTWLTWDVAKSMLNLDKLSLFNTMHSDNKKLLKHPKMIQLFDRYATYNGSDPYQAPGILNIIPHLEHGIGTFLPVNGMHDITTSLVQLALELGVTFVYNTPVQEILVIKNRVKGVKTASGNYEADVVVSNMDVTPTYRKLLSAVKAPERKLQQQRSSSALIFYWGVRHTFSQLGLHNIFFSKDYEQEFRDIFKGNVPASDPTVYVNITSKDVLADAPDGCENWFVMVNVPQHQGQDWDELMSSYRQVIFRKLNAVLKLNLETLIETESTLTPKDIEVKTSSLGGSLYGTSSNSRYAAFLRHANNSKIKGLYFTGGSVHPGGGIPLCMLSAKIVSELCPDPSKSL